MLATVLPARRGTTRHGLTLLELVVVMAVLVAIAAILVPLLPEYLGKGNQSAGATNAGELEKGIQTFRVTYSRHPNYFDSLLTTSGALSNLLPGGGTTEGVAGGYLQVYTMKSGPNSRLSREGITTVYDILDTVTGTDFNATMNPYSGSPPATRTLAANQKVAVLNVAKLKEGTSALATQLDPTHYYAVFGIGKYCNLCGPAGIIKEAPIFGQPSQQNTPATTYQRFAAVYDIGLDDTDTSKYNTKFIGVVAIAPDRLYSCMDLAEGFMENRFDASAPRK